MGKIKRTGGKIYKKYRNENLKDGRKQESKRQKQIITYRLLALFAVTSVTVIFFVYAMNMKRAGLQTLGSISFAGLMFSSGLFIVSGIFLALKLIKNTPGKIKQIKVIDAGGVFAVSAFLFFAFTLIFFRGQTWIPFMTALALAATAVVYLYYLYQREFFWFALFTAAGCFCLYFSQTGLLASGNTDYRIFFKVLLAVLPVLIASFALTLRKNKGRLKCKYCKADIKILGESAKYFQFFILAALSAVFAVLGFLPAAPAPFSFFYLIYAVLGCFIAVGIYFTVKII
ncbi:MAG: hypothetical protein FWH10_06695 [Oscillospiraceae bacterium]|nr:hypothetical protein [Oscillospiraceae bacterium]